MNARTQDANPAASPSTQSTGVPVSVDFANVSDGQLLVYGWVLGLSKRVARAEIRYGDVLIDLMNLGVPVPRSDVAKHFPARVDAGDDAHGFYVTFAVSRAADMPGILRVSVWQKSGEPSISTWPVSTGEAAVAFFFGQYRATLELLMKGLRPAEAERLRRLALPTSESLAPAAEGQLPFGVDAGHVLDGRILVIIGWLNPGEPPLTAARIVFGDDSIDCLPDVKIAASPDDAARVNLRGDSRSTSSFTWAGLLSETQAASAEATLEMAAKSRRGSARLMIARQARSDLAQTLGVMEPDAAMDLLERISALVKADDGTLSDWLLDAYKLGIERLPQSLETQRPRVALHCEAAAPVAPSGLFLIGWFSAERSAVTQITCHNASAVIRFDGTWARASRPDVTAHLKALSVADAEDEHGFLCYLAFDHPAAAYYVSVTFNDGKVRRIRLPTVQPVMSALHSIRTVLTSFALPQRALRALLDQQIGPAVQAAWTHRRAHSRSVSTQRFGPTRGRSAVSVIVPVYGRHDLAEYQMALFADDADFQTAELIYFVDDPSIYDEFQAQCAGLYDIYQVPFTLIFAGENLGFAGANNCAASLARGQHLLLMNSDVLPKTAGWLSTLLALYGTLEAPGLLGVKLLYEDGSVQHAGMNFKRHAPWAGLWINEHPHKGQSAQGLSGLRAVNAVTAACAMVDARLYRELGGLSEDYIIGDFEDSDFCLRAAAAGRRNWVALDIELYHLERQSQARIGDAHWRSNLTLYNCWQHDKRWGTHIEKMKR